MTQKERVLKYIKDFGSISSMEAFNDLGNTRLSASIWLLRHEDELPIESITETKINRYGEQTHYSRYYLKGSNFEKSLNKAKENVFKKIFRGSKND